MAASLWGLVRTQHEFDRHMRTEQAIANGLSEMYAQGLQMGQALRNIVLDPANKKAYENFSTAEAAFDTAYAETVKAARDTELGAEVQELASLRQAQSVQQKRVMMLVGSEPAAAVKALNADETPAWRQLRGKLLAQIETGRKVAAAATRPLRRVPAG